MANRKEVFQAKVLKKLYPAPPQTQEAQGAASDTRAVTGKTNIEAEVLTSQITAGGPNGTPQRKLYTVLPPPDFRTDCEGSVMLTKSEDVNAEGEPPELTNFTSETQISGQQRRRRKRRVGRGMAEVGQEERGEPVVRVTQITEEDRDTTRKNSKNKRRKLKKKRHKEKLLSGGLAPGTVAVEFTYQPAGGNGEEDEEPMKDKEVQSKEGRAAELLEFLQATLEVYYRSPPTGESQEKLSNPAFDAKGLLTSLSANKVPIAVLTQLHHLRSLVLQQDASKLAAALGDFQQNSALLPEEVSAVCCLFRYWITDIFPAQSNKEFREKDAQLP